MMGIGRQRVLLASVALALAGGTSFAQDPEGPEEAPTGSQQQAIVAPDPDQAASFAVLRRAAAGTDRLPEEAAAHVQRSISGDTGAAPQLARRALVSPAGAPVFVVPARGHLCTYVVTAPDQGHGGCAPTGLALQGESVTESTPTPGITRIVGLVPDGIREVTLRAKDGTVEKARVSGNAYVFETAKLPRQLELAGGKVIPVGLPGAP